MCRLAHHTEDLELNNLCFGADLTEKPRVVFPVAGVTFEGRQEALASVSAVFTDGVSFSNYNGGLALQQEPENKYDPFAVGIWAASSLLDGQPHGLTQIGYVPKHYCPGCGAFIVVKKRGGGACPTCGMSIAELPESNLNRWIVEKFVHTGKPLACGLDWIGGGRQGTTLGARVGLWWPRPIGG